VWTEGLCDHIGNEDAARDAKDHLNGSPCPLTSHLRQHDQRSRGREEWLGMADERGSTSHATVAAAVDSTTSSRPCRRRPIEIRSQPTELSFLSGYSVVALPGSSTRTVVSCGLRFSSNR
jgi:hypothetical protein